MTYILDLLSQRSGRLLDLLTGRLGSFDRAQRRLARYVVDLVGGILDGLGDGLVAGRGGDEGAGKGARGEKGAAGGEHC